VRRKLTTPDTWNVIAIIIAVIAIVGGGVWYFNGRTSSQEAFVVKSNGKILVTTGEWATVQANSKAREEQFPGYLVTIDSIVIRKLEEAEAQKRGTTCTTTEATTEAQAGIASLLTSANGRKMALSSVAAYVPASYSLTPEAQRTPALIDALATVAADPTYIETYRQGCDIGKLFTSLSPGPDAGKRNEAISALESQLRNSAALEYGSAATPISAGPALTPTATPAAPTILVGAPSLVGGTVQLPVNTTGSGFAPYSGFSVHLRWTSSVFTFASANSTGTVISSPFCPNPIVDSDGAGVIYACTSTSGSATTTGLLATIVLSPAASGCSPLHLFTFAGIDGGDSTTGTYTIDAGSNSPQTTAYTDGSANVAGQTC
jgi:hypothetical protein